MKPLPQQPRIEKIVCNRDVWYLWLGALVGVYPADYAHTMIRHTVLAVPRKQVNFWCARLKEFQAGALPHGVERSVFVHETVHARQMRGWPFWVWGLRYLASRRFRAAVEEEAYQAQLTYLAEQGYPIEAAPWLANLRFMYAGSFAGRRADEALARMAAAVLQKVPSARITGVPGLAAPATAQGPRPVP
jgi:hypothetical protein